MTDVELDGKPFCFEPLDWTLVFPCIINFAAYSESVSLTSWRLGVRLKHLYHKEKAGENEVHVCRTRAQRATGNVKYEER